MFRCAFRSAEKLIQQSVSRAALVNSQQKRYEVIMRRMYPPNLYKKGIPKALKKREYVYIMEENTNDRSLGEMDVILTIDIEELGYRGDMIKVPKAIARTHLLPVGAAVYPSEENVKLSQQWQEETRDEIRRTKTAEKTLNQLSAMTLPIPMSPKNPWTISKKHVRVALRRFGVQTSEDNITLPKREISEPCEFEFTLTVNKIDKVKIKAIVQHHYPDQPSEHVTVYKRTSRNLKEIIAEAVKRNNLAALGSSQTPV